MLASVAPNAKRFVGSSLPYLPFLSRNPLRTSKGPRKSRSGTWLARFQAPCPPIAGNPSLLIPAQYLVPLSRQTYGYGVAYLLTGDPKYLGYMQAGIDYTRRNAVDRTAQLDLATNTWGPRREFRNPQELGYGLLGPRHVLLPDTGPGRPTAALQCVARGRVPRRRGPADGGSQRRHVPAWTIGRRRHLRPPVSAGAASRAHRHSVL